MVSFDKRETPLADDLTIQLDAEARAAAGALIGSGAYSDGKSQGIAKSPMAKKKLDPPHFSTMIHLVVSTFSRPSTHLKRNNMVAATIPVALYVTEVVPARTAMQQHCPTAAKIMSLRCAIQGKIKCKSDQLGLALCDCPGCRTYSAEPVDQPDRN